MSPFSPSANAFPPTVCGTLTGQHMYFETGSTGNAGILEIAKGTTDGNRNFQIKVTYFTCDNLAKAPAGCTQYFTAVSGSFQSYNHAGNQLLAEMNYNNCFRQREGFCRLALSESTAMNPDAFLLSDPPTMAESDCILLSFLSFSTPTTSMFCGGILNTVDGDTVPGVVTSGPGSSFIVGLQTLDGDLSDLSGFNLDFTQVPCT
ncbi:uncharacterized protein LOC131885278 [Tigriopus californicus]|uniref:uncharacterized protein LOC131885278 n=1 Tax=Tigriopus californicus TaxID=6832 RepID=UPI0027DA2D3C|nr:uncharacterized protein LOC131885278 [Tigriopus californicus]